MQQLHLIIRWNIQTIDLIFSATLKTFRPICLSPKFDMKHLKKAEEQFDFNTSNILSDNNYRVSSQKFIEITFHV